MYYIVVFLFFILSYEITSGRGNGMGGERCKGRTGGGPNFYCSPSGYTLTSGQVCDEWVIKVLLRFTYSSGHSSFSGTVMLSRKQP